MKARLRRLVRFITSTAVLILISLTCFIPLHLRAETDIPKKIYLIEAHAGSKRRHRSEHRTNVEKRKARKYLDDLDDNRQIPQEAKNEFYHGLKKFKENKFKEAITCFEKAKSIYPRYPAVYYKLGKCYSELGDIKRAETNLVRAVHLIPSDGYSHYELGKIYLLQGKESLAKREFKDKFWSQGFCSYSAEDPEIYNLMAKIYAENGRYSEAEECLKLAIQRVSVWTSIHWNLSYLYRRLGEYEKAKLVFERYKVNVPHKLEKHFNQEYASCLMAYASFLKKKGNSEEAQKITEKAKRLKPDKW